MLLQRILCAVFIYYIMIEVSSYSVMNAEDSDPTIIPRSGWAAKPPKEIQPMTNPVPYVVIHHSHEPAACNTSEDCVKAMQTSTRTTGPGRISATASRPAATGSSTREGGWSRVGAHAPTYNNISIGICLIGDWMEALPPVQQLTAVHKLIEMGVRNGMIREDYKLVGHKQVREGTDCPGDMLYEEIKAWPHYTVVPESMRYRVTGQSSTTAAPSYEDNQLRKRSLEN
ncbi:hypothetical protein NQ317_002658 [Molorchus minor]|uniref:Peptidoglycan-recognition protein LB n=1 Tax=Molorchus minor TaxID=1323400 RepID=A0ABQ9JJI9_9CUCU|nr:hypothetical protein NQ317_002658 [Molorchus minor]